jgi:6-phosphogluconolactonase
MPLYIAFLGFENPPGVLQPIFSLHLFMRTTIICLLAFFCSLTCFSQNFYLFVGTYTKGNASKGIYVYQFNAATGETKLVSTAATENPSYLAVAPGEKFLYAVNETGGQEPGAVSSFAFDKGSGQLRFLNKQTSGGEDPCYISVDPHRKWAMVANYSGGSLSALPIHADGTLGTLAQKIQHTGSGPNKERQEKPHVHSTTFTPDGKYLIAADLGLDKLSIYRFNASASQPLTTPKDSTQQVEPGSGPRHISFYPGKPYVYLMTEMGGAVDAFHYADGRLKQLQHISSLPDGFKGDIGSADIHVAPGGKFLYASNRGDANSLAIYSIDSTTGQLTIKGFESTQGMTPRNFMIDPTGHWLLVANQRSDNVVLFRIDPATGMLKSTGQQISIPTPVCLKMIRN